MNPEKPNCYNCKHRRNITYDAHSSCAHPAFGENEMSRLLFSILPNSSEECRVVGDPHGIRNGWFTHPFNFDPTWLLSCSGFEKKDE